MAILGKLNIEKINSSIKIKRISDNFDIITGNTGSGKSIKSLELVSEAIKDGKRVTFFNSEIEMNHIVDILYYFGININIHEICIIQYDNYNLNTIKDFVKITDMIVLDAIHLVGSDDLNVLELLDVISDNKDVKFIINKQIKK